MERLLLFCLLFLFCLITLYIKRRDSLFRKRLQHIINTFINAYLSGKIMKISIVACCFPFIVSFIVSFCSFRSSPCLNDTHGGAIFICSCATCTALYLLVLFRSAISARKSRFGLHFAYRAGMNCYCYYDNCDCLECIGDILIFPLIEIHAVIFEKDFDEVIE